MKHRTKKRHLLSRSKRLRPDEKARGARWREKKGVSLLLGFSPAPLANKGNDMNLLCQQCKPEPTGQRNLAQCRGCGQLYRIDDGRPCDGHGNPLVELEPVTIKCAACWLPTTLLGGFLETIKEKTYTHLPCGHKVPVQGKEGVLERVRRAKEDK